MFVQETNYCRIRLRLLELKDVTTTSEMAKALKISRYTTRRILDQLVDEGIAYRQFAKGTYNYIHRLNVPKEARS